MRLRTDILQKTVIGCPCMRTLVVVNAPKKYHNVKWAGDGKEAGHGVGI